MKNLKALMLDSTQLTGDGLRYVEKLTNLKDLGLSHTQVTDTALRHLERLTKLREVDLQFTRVSDQGVENLKTVLPNARIYHYVPSRAGGARNRGSPEFPS